MSAPDTEPALVIRPMRESDTERMQELHRACLRELCAKDYSDQQIEGWLAGRTPAGYVKMVETHGERMFVATLDDVVVGFASWRDIELCSLYVDPNHNGKGIGWALHQACDDDASTMRRRIIRVDSMLTGRRFLRAVGIPPNAANSSQQRRRPDSSANNAPTTHIGFSN